MSRFLIVIFHYPFMVVGQSSSLLSKKDLTKLYTQAITDFIKDANQTNKTKFDTLLFGKHKNGQTDDFPNIELPPFIENTSIRLVNPEIGKIKQLENKTNIYINLMGWVNHKSAEFIFVVFSNGFKHQYDYYINYTLEQKVFKLQKIERKNPPFEK